VPDSKVQDFFRFSDGPQEAVGSRFSRGVKQRFAEKVLLCRGKARGGGWCRGRSWGWVFGVGVGVGVWVSWGGIIGVGVVVPKNAIGREDTSQPSVVLMCAN
jgi:hypothetical protein